MENNKKIESFLKEGKGYIVLGETLSTQDTREIRDVFSKLENIETKEIIVDMKNVKQIDSSGIGVLVIYMKRLKEKNKELKILEPKEEIKRIFKLVNLYSYFEIM